MPQSLDDSHPYQAALLVLIYAALLAAVFFLFR